MNIEVYQLDQATLNRPLHEYLRKVEAFLDTACLCNV